MDAGRAPPPPASPPTQDSRSLRDASPGGLTVQITSRRTERNALLMAPGAAPAASLSRRAALGAALPALAASLLVAGVAAAGLVAAAPAQAADDDILFRATLTDNEQSTPTYSPGNGIAEFRLERATLKLSWKVTYQNTTSPVIAAGLYGPENVGANAGLVVDLANGKLKSPITGSTVLSDGVFQYLVTGRIYANLHTTRYKDGELRGQLLRVRR